MILRIPGIGVKSAKKIISARRFGKLGQEQLKKLGIAMNRAQYFITSKNYFNANDWDSLTLRNLIIQSRKSKYSNKFSTQLSLF